MYDMRMYTISLSDILTVFGLLNVMVTSQMDPFPLRQGKTVYLHARDFLAVSILFLKNYKYTF